MYVCIYILFIYYCFFIVVIIVIPNLSDFTFLLNHPNSTTPQLHSPVAVPRSQGVGFQGQLLNETNLSNLVPLANVTTVVLTVSLL